MSDDTKSPLQFGVELVNGQVHLLTIGTLEGETTVIAAPITAAEARALASYLLGAAAVADPPGHQVILDSIREMFLAQVTGQAPTTPTTH